MTPLSTSTSDAELIAFVDQWAALLEKKAYSEAFAFTDQAPNNGWTAELIQEFIEGYNEAVPGQHFTLEGKPTDISQRKNVRRFPKNRASCIGQVWYDLNINGFASDITATFGVVSVQDGLILQLDDIHVM